MKSRFSLDKAGVRCKSRGFLHRALHLSLLAVGCGLLLSVSGGSRGFSAPADGAAAVADSDASVAVVGGASASASGGEGGITLGQWQAASELAPEKVGSFRVEVRRPGIEPFSQLFIGQWADAVRGVADTQAFSDFAERQAQ